MKTLSQTAIAAAVVLFSACGAGPSASAGTELLAESFYAAESPTQWDVNTPDIGDELGTESPGGSSAPASPAPGSPGMTPRARRPAMCTPAAAPVRSPDFKLKLGLIRVHVPGYCLNGEAKCTDIAFASSELHPGTPYPKSASVDCTISPTKRMRGEVTYSNSGVPQSGSLRFEDSQAGVVFESNAIAFPNLSRAPFLCEQGAAASIRGVGPATSATRDGEILETGPEAELGIMVRLME